MDVNEDHMNSSNSNSEETVQYEEIEDTPIGIIGSEDKGYFLTFGKYRVSEVMETKEAALMHFNNKGWHVMVAVMTAIINFNETNKD